MGMAPGRWVWLGSARLRSRQNDETTQFVVEVIGFTKLALREIGFPASERAEVREAVVPSAKRGAGCETDRHGRRSHRLGVLMYQE